MSPVDERRPRTRFLGVAAAIPLALTANQALAFRPFESTDADVTDAGELEIEWGAVTLSRQNGENTYIVPDLVFNLGVTDHSEVIAEFTMKRTGDDQWEPADAGAFIKTMWREGVLQGRSGISFATEFGALLPGTPADEDGVGAEGIFIASTRLDRLALHINGGGGITRTGSDTFARGGLIAEYPTSKTVQLVAEMSGEKVSGEDLEASLLFGTIVTPDWLDGEIDFGVRRGLTPEAADWTVTVGATFAFQAF